jgi:orotate phosphoribosyltransferase-like protein
MKLRKTDPKAPPRQRQTTADLRAQVLDMRARGMVLGAIADALNVSDQRVRKILREAATPAPA